MDDGVGREHLPHERPSKRHSALRKRNSRIYETFTERVEKKGGKKVEEIGRKDSSGDRGASTLKN